MTIERIQCGPRMSQAVVHAKTVYVAGQVASTARGGSITEQTREILGSIDSLLAKAKTHKGNLLSATIWLTNMASFAEMNAVWDAWVTPGSTPARATVVSPELASKDYGIEIAVVAAQV